MDPRQCFSAPGLEIPLQLLTSEDKEHMEISFDSLGPAEVADLRFIVSQA